jgi:hypothetical protein
LRNRLSVGTSLMFSISGGCFPVPRKEKPSSKYKRVFCQLLSLQR